MVRIQFAVIYLSVAAAADITTAAQDVGESCADAEGATHFLQMSSNSMRGAQAGSLNQGPPSDSDEVSMVQPFSCEKYANPSQVLGASGGFKASSLDVKTGKYTQIFDIPFDRIKGGYKDLNACGVNPSDSRLYCHMKTKKNSMVVRLDENIVEFVAKLPPSTYNTGGFSPLGEFFIANGWSYFVVVKDLNSTKGYLDETDKGILDLKKTLKKKQPEGFGRSGDCVVVYDDLEKTGTKASYLFVLYGKKLSIAKWLGDSFGKTWIIEVDPDREDTVYGAGWSFGGRVMFASNEGRGVYQIPMDELDLSTKAKLTLTKVGNSDPNGNNDGINCLNAMDPWLKTAPLLDCSKEKDQRPTQIIKQLNGDYVIGELNHEDGKYETKVIVAKNLTSPWIKVLNAVAVNPKDGQAYGCLRIKQWPEETTPSEFFVVRFNAYQIEFLAKVLPEGRKGDGIAGSFGPGGTFYFVAKPLLYGLQDVENMKGYLQYNDTAIPEVKAEVAFNMTDTSGYNEIADIVVVEKEFDGKGKANFVLGVNNAQDLVVVKISKEAVKFSAGWNLKVNKVTEKGQGMNWGAAWVYDNEAYFAQNDGAGVYTIDQSKIELGTPGQQKDKEIELVKVGKSVETHDNDGLNCQDASNPWAK
mmetsp:Transcript_100544/g.174577  ORF Transcript_100544/g.174577 Transcript_100544/m.174577 type:complete len:640 (+) Transcript_100544:114-2033(+)